METSTRKLPKEITPPDYLSIIWKHLTEETCNEVFKLTRNRERQRKWTLFALLQMWIGILQHPSITQTEAVESCGKDNPFFPKVDASAESFFMRIQKLGSIFFRNIFLHFTKKIEEELLSNFASHLSIPEEEFPEIDVVDGSRLAKVGRILKVARHTTKAIIPGSIEGVYDLRRGTLRNLWFDPDGAKSEIVMFEKVLGKISSGALLVSDRYYSKPILWKQLQEKNIWMVSRHNATVKKKKIKVLSRVRTSRIAIDDWIVEMGGSQPGQEPVVLRWVHVRNSEGEIILITNVLDPKKLSCDQLLSLYRERWSIERMYLHLKEVLALNHLFNASPQAVAGQVYATGIIYNALRCSQASIARKCQIAPELLSPQKLFPRVIDKLVKITWATLGAEWAFKRMGIVPTSDQVAAMYNDLPKKACFNLSLSGVLVEKRKGKKRKRRFCAGRKSWTTYNKILGGKKYL